MPAQVTVGVSLKMYFGHREALRVVRACRRARARRTPRCRRARSSSSSSPPIRSFCPPSRRSRAHPVRIGAQDVAAADTGAFTGEVSAVELAEIGVELAEIGHAERRRLFHETDADTAAKAAAALRNGVTPVLCVGETDRLTAADAAAATVAQLSRDLDGAPAGPRHRRLRAGVGDRCTRAGARRAHRRGRPARCAPRSMRIPTAPAARSSTAARPDPDC